MENTSVADDKKFASPGDLAANVADMSPTCDAVTHFGSDMRVVGTQISSVGM
jgi:hypothetical protein